MSRQHDPLAMKLSPADDRVMLSKWLPPQAGVVPRIRIGNRWINVLWALPLIFLALVLGVTLARAMRELPTVQSFLLRYPGVPTTAVAVTAGFPGWLRLMHFLNLFFMTFIVAPAFRSWPITRGCTGSATARRERSGFDSKAQFPPAASGLPKMIQ
jgi:hypothetical protein